MDEETLIRLIVEEVVKLLSERAAEASEGRSVARKGVILALFTGGNQMLEVCLREVARLRDEGFEIVPVASKSAVRVIGEEKIKAATGARDLYVEGAGFIDTDELIGMADAIIVPVLTRNTAMKIAGVITDSPITSLVVQACMLRKPVIAVRNSADPSVAQCACVGLSSGPAPLLDEIRRNLQKLESFGITLVSADGLYAATTAQLQKQQPAQGLQPAQPAALPSGRFILTSRDVEDAISRGEKAIEVPAGAIVTDIAMEAARRASIAIRFKD